MSRWLKVKEMKVLVIEDDPDISDVIATAFELGWPDVSLFQAFTGIQGLAMVESKSPDVVILDLGLPDMTGFDVLSHIRLFSEVPLIILTVRNEESNIVKALTLGADDYLTKPFRQMELLARIKAISRRIQNRESVSGIQIGDWRFNNSPTECFHGDTPIHLTSTEGVLLSFLMKHAGKFVGNEALSRHIWNRTHSEVADALRVYISHVREKIGDDPKYPKIIVNKPRQGYMFVSP
jgi:two-component system KDP operon response regulator KdpE